MSRQEGRGPGGSSYVRDHGRLLSIPGPWNGLISFALLSLGAQVPC